MLENVGIGASDGVYTLDKVLTGHQRWVWDMAYSADSAYLVSGEFLVLSFFFERLAFQVLLRLSKAGKLRFRGAELISTSLLFFYSEFGSYS